MDAVDAGRDRNSSASLLRVVSAVLGRRKLAYAVLNYWYPRLVTSGKVARELGLSLGQVHTLAREAGVGATNRFFVRDFKCWGALWSDEQVDQLREYLRRKRLLGLTP